MIHHIRHRIIVAWTDVLPDHDGKPGRVIEQFLILSEYPSSGAKQAQFISKIVGNLHVPCIGPEVGVFALIGMVMKNEKVD